MSRLLNKTLYVRTLSGIALLIVVLGTVLWSPYSMLALGVFLTAGIMREFYRIGRLTGARPLTTYPIVVGAAIVVLAFLIKTGTLAPVCLAAALPAVFVLFIAELYLKNENPLHCWAYTMLGQMYIALPFSMVNVLAFQTTPEGMLTVDMLLPLSVFVLLWTNDTGAYCAGSLLGKHKLFPRVSPGKSWEGSIGGGVLVLVVSYLIGWYVNQGAEPHVLNEWQWMGLGLVVCVFGTWGDLVESLLKRTIGVKDSGNVIPGHGGMLDRFDSSLMALPAAVVYLYSLTLLG